ncbi:hypothetical protein RB195_021771 [Necator americanus]|uniref:Uncharacterized protein n=1 Tax=Necator americanus TaxID=51031 RepID=A0ABR1ECL1_NECAM
MNGSTKGIRNENLRFPYRNQLSSRRSFTPNIRVDLPSTSNSIELSNCNPSTTHLSRFNPSPRTSTSLNATPKAKHETVVNYDFADDPMPPNTCCCGKVKIQMGCRIVATCSLLAIIANAVLYFFGIPRLGLSGTIEIVLLIIDFLTVFFLFLGLSKHRAGLLKPYLFFNSLWTFCLCLLLLVCLWKIIRGGELSNNILSNLQNIRAQPTEEPEDDYHRRIHPTNSQFFTPKAEEQKSYRNLNTYRDDFYAYILLVYYLIVYVNLQQLIHAVDSDPSCQHHFNIALALTRGLLV